MNRNSFWAQLYFEDFIRHFRKLDDAAIVADVRQSMDDFENRCPEGSSFGAEMVASTFARIRGNREKSARFGILGGRPRKLDAPGPQFTPVPAGQSFEDGSLPSDGACLTPVACLRGATGQHSKRADAPQGDRGEAGASGFATSPSTFPRRPGKSATSFVGKSSDQGGSERGAGGTAIDAVRHSPGAKRAEPKLPHGSAGNVLLTETEARRLADEFGDVGQLVEEMSDYLLLHPNKYRSHYAALRNWCRRRRQEGRNPDGTRMTQGDRLARYFAEREQEIIHGHNQDQ